MLTLNNLKSPKGATRKTKRIGRGQGSGWGTQAGKGHKGQKARAGGGVQLGFEGGQMPIYRRLPKRGFSNAPFKKEFAILNLGQLDQKLKGDIISREVLVEQGFLSGRFKSLPLKVLGDGELNRPLTFNDVEKFSEKAKALIEKSGGKIVSKDIE